MTNKEYPLIMTIQTTLVKKGGSPLPKCYSELEKAYIKQRLKEEAEKCLAQYGIRRTTVDELVKRVKIPKGTFYLFYRSKELLLFEVILDLHERIEQELLASLSVLDPHSLTVDHLTEVLFGCFKAMDDVPVLKLLNSDDMELLARKLPPEVIADHLKQDDTMVEKLFAIFPMKAKQNAEAFSAALRVLFLSSLQKEEIGDKQFDKALKLLIRGLVLQMLS